jgi:polyisoprenyl-phosphate glycosyltransferase
MAVIECGGVAAGSGRVAGPRLSIVVPCYNESEGLSEMHLRVSAAAFKQVGYDYELVLVNDGSRDDTWPKILDLVNRDPRVVGVSLSRNHGHQLALSAGLTLCRGARILVIDADLQDPPELLPDMMALMDQGAEVVYGQRLSREGETWFKRTTAGLFYRLLARLVEIQIPLDSGDFRLISRRALDVLNAMPEQHRFIRGMVSWIGMKQVPLKYNRHERFTGETKYPLSKMMRLAVDAITGFSIRPLKIASYMGMVFGLLGALGMAYTLYGWLTNLALPGWTSVMSIVLVLGSAQLFVLGVFGEYLGRLYLESKRRPLFVIDQVAGGSFGNAAMPARVREAEPPRLPATRAGA